MKTIAIAYILAEFPSYTETFVLREALFINQVFQLYIFALKKGGEPLDKHLREAFGNRLVYVPSWTSREMIKYIPTVIRITLDRDNGMPRRDASCRTRRRLAPQPAGQDDTDARKKSIWEHLRRVKHTWVSLFIAGRIKEMTVHHIHAHFAGYPADLAMYVAEMLNISFSFTAHAHDIYVNSDQLAEKIHYASFIATCTQYNKNRLDSLVPTDQQDKIHLVYHGVDLNNWTYRPPSETGMPLQQLLSIGRLIEKKGFHYLLKAVQILTENGYHIQLCIIGEGKDKTKLKQYCHRHALVRSVFFTGWQNVEHIKLRFARSDIFVLPSIVASNGDRDGIPNVILEAMASGVPVVSTLVSGIPEVISHRNNGLLVPEKDADRLAQAIKTLINDQYLQQKIIENARRTVEEKFDDKRGNAVMKRLFEECVCKIIQ
jgi:glycosyltransferase involved in cell wall biosynthesis